MSPRNSAPAVVNMLEKTSCHRVIVNSALAPLMDAVKAELSAKGSDYEVQVDELPDLYEMFPSLHPDKDGREISEVTPYPNVSAEFSLDEPALYLHSSGSTGFPKPIKQTHRTMLEWCHSGMCAVPVELCTF